MKVEQIQQALVWAGYDLGTTGPNGDGVDGDAGPKTYAAMQQFRVDYDLILDLGGDTGAGLQHFLEQGADEDSGEHPPEPPDTEDGETTVPPEWMPACSMERVIFHWTAGKNTANADDLEHYHILIQGDGSLVKGDHSIEDNVSTSDGVYAAHTKDCNTGSIGVSLCGMMDAVEQPFQEGPCPINEVQWDALAHVLADLCNFYKIEVDRTTVLSHAEVQDNLGIPQEGKWDIARLPWNKSIMLASEIGGQMRDMVKPLITSAPKTA